MKKAFNPRDKHYNSQEARKGYGYTKSREEAGVFTLKDMEELNLDGCTLERAEVAFLDEDGPSPDLPHRVTLPRD
ncbi:hypothetical protein RZ66_07765 [[Haemophilus] ducreyi]|nr:hypothetical protein RZ66_07765 [[Haemophilus] ducreyi]